MVKARYVSGDEGPIDSAQAVFEPWIEAFVV